jgi:phosphate transport system substrate-binding protein
MNNLMTLWLEGFQTCHPKIGSDIQGKGSSTAIPALVAGTSDIGPMSRSLGEAERDTFEVRFGRPATQLATCLDVLAVYVNKENPIEGLTLPQVDAIFSSTRRLGYPSDITTWGQLGLEGDWKDAPIIPRGRNSASAAYGYFKKHVLGGGDYKASVRELRPLLGVARDRHSIGYSGIGYVTRYVRALPLARAADAQPVPPDAKHAYSGEYPLARPMRLTLDYSPDGKLKPLLREFLRFVYSRQGQEMVLRGGYYPLDFHAAAAEAKKVGIELKPAQ